MYDQLNRVQVRSRFLRMVSSPGYVARMSAGLDTKPERDAFEASYRRFLIAFQVPVRLADPDVLFGKKDLIDAGKRASAEEEVRSAIASAYGGMGLAEESLRPTEDDSPGFESAPVVYEQAALLRLLDRSGADEPRTISGGDSNP